jgi:hypothetical protein
VPAGQGGDDEAIARLLILTWAIATARTLRDDVPPGELTPGELIEFWADDLTAGPDVPRPGTAAA